MAVMLEAKKLYYYYFSQLKFGVMEKIVVRKKGAYENHKYRIKEEIQSSMKSSIWKSPVTIARKDLFLNSK